MSSASAFARLLHGSSSSRAALGGGAGCVLFSSTTFCEKQASVQSNRLASRAVTSRLVSSSATTPSSIYHHNSLMWSPWRRFSSTTTSKPSSLSSSQRFASSSSSTKATAAPEKAATAAAASTETTTATASSTSSSSSGGGLLAWYEGHLQTRPVVTKMITGALLWGIGDAVAQIVPAMVMETTTSSDGSSTANNNNANNNKSAALFAYDWPRTGRAALFGFAFHAPASHVHFNFLEWLTIQTGVTGLKIPIFKAFMEQFVYWSWLSNSMYHGCMGAMQGQNLTQIYNKIADVLWETQKAQWVFWIPVQLLNFRFVPVRHQLNVVLLTSIVWTALLSAWYPPEPEQQPSEEETSEQKVEETK